ncbi:DUF5789 family protein [Halomarina oriensis]|uniref:DUF5789 family protein n=1 Tax=Halomarina oriensis TaxID=671145 RepID=UPI0037420655
MADDDSEAAASEEDDGPIVELGEGPAVDGAPLSRISSRLHFGIEHSEVVRREGDTEIRTPDGPRTIESVLDETDETYFPTAESLRTTVEGIVGTGAVPTREREDDTDDTDEEAPDGAADADDVPTDGDDTDAPADESDEE